MAIPAAPPPSTELPFKEDGSSRPPPPTDDRFEIEDEQTEVHEPLNPARETAAMPIIRVPELGPAWTQHPSPPPPDNEHTADLEGGKPSVAIPLPPSQGRKAAEIDLEAYAMLRASLDTRPDDTSDILEEADVHPNEWAKARERWEGQLALSARTGNEELMLRFDRAYIAQLDEERGEPYQLRDYAAFDAATETGTGEAKLREQRMPEAAKMPLRRHWLRALMADENLRSRYYEEVDAARG